MFCDSYLNDLSREQLYSVISQLDSVTNELKTEIKCLKTDLIKSKLLSDCYQRYFDYFNEINETIDLNEEVLDLLAKIKSLNNENQCFVSLKRLESQTSLNRILSYEPKTSDLRIDAINPSNSDTENNSQQIVDCDETNSLRNFEESDYQSTDQLKGDQSIVETSTIISKRSVRRPKGSKNKSKKRFKCLSNGCEKEFFGIRGLNIHLREHQLRKDPKISLKGRKVNAISNTFTKANQSTNLNVNVSTNTFTRVIPIGGSNASEKANQSTNLNEDKNQKLNENYIKSKKSDTEVNNLDNYTDEEVNNSTDQTIVETSVKINNHKSKKIIGFKKLGRPNSCKNKAKPRFDCLRSGCEQSFTDKRGLNLHTLRKHQLKCNQKNGSNIKTIICDFEGCEFQTVTKDRLTKHKLKHSNEHPCVCVFCGKPSKDTYMARDHLLAVHPEKCPEFPYIECPQNGCEYKTKLSRYMLRHERTHTLPFVCEYCQIGFADKCDLREHLSTHTGARDYVCPHCQRSFKRHSQLSRHKKVHNKTLFVCEFKGCKKSFVLESRLRLHIKCHNNS